MEASVNKHHQLSAAGVLIALGIIYGDIGTSPIYTLKFIIGTEVITEDIVLGGLSCIFWTLTIITSVKYIYLALNADNKGEGGIFALYALVRKYKVAWVIYPAIIGCCTLIADGFITPAISVSSAVEGLKILYPSIPTIPIVVTILIGLFLFQQFGSAVVGKTFGPIMAIWFIMLAALGTSYLIQYPEVLKALNPAYAIKLLTEHQRGFWLLGAVFLCTTGAEALYSDLGHCGKSNIRVSWVFVKVCILLNYFGQSGWLLSQKGTLLGDQSPFFSLMPEWFLLLGIIVATLATIIASQALISGTFSLVYEAVKLKLWPATQIHYPNASRGQMYIPMLNWILMVGSILVIMIFKESSAMEGAYGLAITVNMLMTTSLLAFYFLMVKKSPLISTIVAVVFFTIEGMFLASNLSKFEHGGWFTFLIAFMFFTMMFILHKARLLRQQNTEFVDLRQYEKALKDLQADDSVPKEASHLVYLAAADSRRFIDSNIIYSIFRKGPKRADVYWFVHIETVDSPYTSKYSVDAIIPRKCFFVRIKLGFKVPPRFNLYFSRILSDLAEENEVDLLSPYKSLHKFGMKADFKFIILYSWASADSSLTSFDRIVIAGYSAIKSISLPVDEQFELETANVEVENVPIQIGEVAKVHIKREKNTPSMNLN